MYKTYFVTVTLIAIAAVIKAVCEYLDGLE